MDEAGTVRLPDSKWSVNLSEIYTNREPGIKQINSRRMGNKLQEYSIEMWTVVDLTKSLNVFEV